MLGTQRPSTNLYQLRRLSPWSSNPKVYVNVAAKVYLYVRLVQRNNFSHVSPSTMICRIDLESLAMLAYWIWAPVTIAIRMFFRLGLFPQCEWIVWFGLNSSSPWGHFVFGHVIKLNHSDDGVARSVIVKIVNVNSAYRFVKFSTKIWAWDKGLGKK